MISPPLPLIPPVRRNAAWTRKWTRGMLNELMANSIYQVGTLRVHIVHARRFASAKKFSVRMYGESLLINAYWSRRCHPGPSVKKTYSCRHYELFALEILKKKFTIIQKFQPGIVRKMNFHFLIAYRRLTVRPYYGPQCRRMPMIASFIRNHQAIRRTVMYTSRLTGCGPAASICSLKSAHYNFIKKKNFMIHKSSR